MASELFVSTPRIHLGSEVVPDRASWIKLCPTKNICRSPNSPGSQNVTFFGDRILIEMLCKLKQGAPIQNDWYPYKMGKFGHRHMQREGDVKTHTILKKSQVLMFLL